MLEIDIKHVAKLARLRIEDEKVEMFQRQMGDIIAMVERLPERCRAVFRLRMEGMRNEEIAGRLRLSVETVKTQNKKALAFLREELGRTFSILAMLGMIEL